MKPPRTPRPAPRTLAAAPPVGLRAPQPAAPYGHRLPTLAALLAAGAAPGCADTVCGSSRAEELETHGRLGVQAARGGEATRAVREIGIALGVVNHTTTRVPDVVAAGAMPMVQPQPPPQPPPVIDPGLVTAGAPMPVTPVPPPTPPTPSQVTTPGNDHPPARPGQMRRTTPTPPPRPTPPRHEPGIAVPGGLGAVGPLPTTLSRHPA